MLGDPEVTANIYCKSRNLPNKETLTVVSTAEKGNDPYLPQLIQSLEAKRRQDYSTAVQNVSYKNTLLFFVTL